VLRQGGYACIRNGTRESDFPHRHFFPGLQALINSDLPSRLSAAHELVPRARALSYVLAISVSSESIAVVILISVRWQCYSTTK
jgi:hypothetical protein